LKKKRGKPATYDGKFAPVAQRARVTWLIFQDPIGVLEEYFSLGMIPFHPQMQIKQRPKIMALTVNVLHTV
jgi:hypothetical protein